MPQIEIQIQMHPSRESASLTDSSHTAIAASKALMTNDTILLVPKSNLPYKGYISIIKIRLFMIFYFLS